MTDGIAKLATSPHRSSVALYSRHLSPACGRDTLTEHMWASCEFLTCTWLFS